MKKFGILAGILAIAGAANAQDAFGNLVVIKVGDGAAALSGNATAFTIDQYTTGGSFVNTNAVTSMTMSGSATSEGYLNFVYFGGDGTNLNNWGVSFGGYNAAVGTSGIAGTNSSTVTRRGGVLRFGADTQTAVDFTAATNPFSTGNIRAVSFDGQTGTYAAVGSTTGVVRANSTGASTVVSTTVTNDRVVQIAGNDMYFSTGSGTRGIYMVPGGMTGTGITATNILNMGGSSSPYDFEMQFDGSGTPVSVLVADDGTGTGGGIYMGSGWSGSAFATSTQIATPAAITAALGGGTTVSVRQMVVSGTDIFATTTEGNNNRIIKLSFANGFSNGITSGSVLASAGANKAFRGIEAVPEPASFAVMGLGLLGLAARRRRKN